MDVTYSDSARERGEDFSLLQQATKRLQEILGPSADLVKAEWGRTEDEKHQTLYTLRISDGTDAATAVLDLQDLQSASHTSYRLYRLWDDILGARLNRQLEKLQASSSTEN